MGIGVASVAVIGAVYSTGMFINTIVKTSIWKKRGIYGTGFINGLKKVETTYKNEKHKKIESKKYIYRVRINCDGRFFDSEYIETVKGDKPSNTNPAMEFEVYWDDKKLEYFNYTQAKKGLWEYPLTFLLCVAIFLLCMAVACALS